MSVIEPHVPTPPRLEVPGGLLLCSVALLVGGFVFLLTGILYLVAPESLRDAGFRPDAGRGIRVGGLLAFGAVGALLAWTAWRLIHLGAFAHDVTRGLALSTAAVFVTRLAGGGAGSSFNWIGVCAAAAVAFYLNLPSVRALFRRDGGRATLV
jgi:hypothetical protein